MSVDTWHFVPGYSEHFEIDLRSKCVRNKHTGRTLTTTHDGKGRPIVHLWLDGEHRTIKIHRVLGEILFGPLAQAVVVRHLNDDHTDNRLCNLAPGSQGDNMRDAVRNGRHSEARRTHCPKGHEYTPENTRVSRTADGRVSRHCRTCHEQRPRRRRTP